MLLIWTFAMLANALATISCIFNQGLVSVEVTARIACAVACLAMLEIELNKEEKHDHR